MIICCNRLLFVSISSKVEYLVVEILEEISLIEFLKSLRFSTDISFSWLSFWGSVIISMSCFISPKFIFLFR
ncbi:hypothetical protein [Rickettsia sp. R1]